MGDITVERLELGAYSGLDAPLRAIGRTNTNRDVSLRRWVRNLPPLAGRSWALAAATCYELGLPLRPSLPRQAIRAATIAIAAIRSWANDPTEERFFAASDAIEAVWDAGHTGIVLFEANVGFAVSALAYAISAGVDEADLRHHLEARLASWALR